MRTIVPRIQQCRPTCLACWNAVSIISNKKMTRILIKILPWFCPRPPLGVETTLGNPVGTPILRAMPLPTELSVQLCCRKSSSISSTLARRLRDERSFISMSLICLLLAAGPAAGFLWPSSFLSHGRLIRSTQGSQCKNTVRTYVVDSNA